MLSAAESEVDFHFKRDRKILSLGKSSGLLQSAARVNRPLKSFIISVPDAYHSVRPHGGQFEWEDRPMWRPLRIYSK